jgi:hypothetical protein
MKKVIFLSLVFFFTNISCSVYETFVNISRLKFKLGNVNGFNLNGVAISNKSKLQDFNATEILKISSAVAQGKLPITFTLNIEAKNPNDGTGGYKKTNATLQSFPFRLLIDDKETISGNIGAPVTVPGTGEITILPLQMQLDLVDFFANKGYESLINLALSIGGSTGSSSRLALYAQPTVTTAIGNITYPNELKIISAEFTN